MAAVRMAKEKVMNRCTFDETSISLISVSCSLHALLNKLTSVFYASVLLLMINCVTKLSKWQWNHEPQASGSAVNFDNLMTKFTSITEQMHKNWRQFAFYNNKTPKWPNDRINEGKKYCKLAVNKDKLILLKMTQTMSIALLTFWLAT